MYNSIYPININYRNNPYQAQGNSKAAQDSNQQAKSTPQKEYPNTPYTPQSNKINISQILTDFKNTILAINAPEEVQDEVGMYLGLVEKEASKQNPSREIILANLKNASKISDAYIASALGKQSNVVEGWITTIFKQDINLKANPDEINPDYLLQFPKNAQDKINKPLNAPKSQDVPKQSTMSVAENNIFTPRPIQKQAISEIKIVDAAPKSTAPSTIESIEFISKPKEEEIQIASQSMFELSQEEDETLNSQNIFSQNPPNVRTLYNQALQKPKTPQGSADALNLLNEALGMIDEDNSLDEASKKDTKAALHIERGKIFDSYDYVDYALRDFWEGTKANNPNMQAYSFHRLGALYDEFKNFEPALDNYLSSVAYSGQAENLDAQSLVLSKIAGLYAQRFDSSNTQDYTELSIDTALDTNNDRTIAKAYSTGAQNLQYIGENKQALENYKNALKAFSRDDESYEQMAYNYEQAAVVMEKLGNSAKAAKLQARAAEYYQIAQQQREQLAQAS